MLLPGAVPAYVAFGIFLAVALLCVLPDPYVVAPSLLWACEYASRFRQLRHLPPSALRNSERAFYTDFIGEHADDYGGPYREALSLVAAELSDPASPLRLLQVRG